MPRVSMFGKFSNPNGYRLNNTSNFSICPNTPKTKQMGFCFIISNPIPKCRHLYNTSDVLNPTYLQGSIRRWAFFIQDIYTILFFSCQLIFFNFKSQSPVVFLLLQPKKKKKMVNKVCQTLNHMNQHTRNCEGAKVLLSMFVEISQARCGWKS